MNEYKPGDRLYVFGSSFGAFAAQALAALLHMFGLVPLGDEVLLEETLSSFLSGGIKKFAVARDTRFLYSQECKPHFMGLWETPASVGFYYSPLTLPYAALNPDVNIGRHALAIDERRAQFWPSLWRAAATTQDIKEVWFPGAHSDVGGSYPEQESGLARISFEWMIGEACAAGLLVDPVRLDYVLGRTSGTTEQDQTAPLHASLNGIWWLNEFWPHRVMLPRGNSGQLRAYVRPPLGRRRFIPRGAAIHDSVFKRMDAFQYRPPNFPTEYVIEATKPIEPRSPVHDFRANEQVAILQQGIANDNVPRTRWNDAVSTNESARLTGESTAKLLKVFLCYVPSDTARIQDLCQRLRAAGFDPWIAVERLLPGDDWKVMIPEMVRAVDLFLVCLSREFNSKTDFAHRVVKHALGVAAEKPDGTKFIIPLRLEEVELPPTLEDWYPVNYFESTGWEKLLSALRKYAVQA
jgi:hypothetical protein